MKGIWFTMESVIACIIIGMFVLVVVGGYSFDAQPVDVGGTALDVLKGLDDRGALRSYAAALDYNGLDSEIDIAGYNHTIMICDEAGVCAGYQPDANDIWVGSYFIAGSSAYQPLEIKLFLWED